MLKYYGLSPIRDRKKTKAGDQIDVIAEFEGKQLLIETSYTKDPTSISEIGELNTKLERRQPNCIGIWFSMSDFTIDAIKCASDLIGRRTSVLFNNIEIKSIFGWGADFEMLLRKKIFMQSKEAKIFFQPDKEKEEQPKEKYEFGSFHKLILEEKKVDWIQTSTSEIGCLIFSPIFYGFVERNYHMEVFTDGCTIDDIKRLLGKYNEIFGITHKSAFCINQTNYSWFGTGAQEFIKALEERDIRYKGAQDIKRHHSETAVFIDEIPGWNGGIFSLSMQPSVDTDLINHVSINFLITRMPFTKNRYEKFFEIIQMEPECIHIYDEEVTYMIDVSEIHEIPLRDIGKFEIWKDHRDEYWVDGIIVNNPFFKKEIKPHEMHKGSFDISDAFINHLSSFKKLPLFLTDHHGIDDDMEYYLQSLMVTEIPCSGFAGFCVNARTRWEWKD